MEQQGPVLDLSFRLQGESIPADHGYLLYAAISRHLPWIHGDEAVGIHPIRGQLIGQRQLALTAGSELVLRLPTAKIPEAIPLAGRRLELEQASVLVGVPAVRALLPRASLFSRLVVIRGFTEAAPFLEAVHRQLAERGIDGLASLVLHRGERALEGQIGGRQAVVRRTLRIRDREVVGFAVQVSGLDAAGSLDLQVMGLGGRRRFGCGVFVPAAW